MKFLSKINAAYDRFCLRTASFVLNYPGGFMGATLLIGTIALLLFVTSDAGAQLEQQVTDALNPLARLLVGPIAKGLAIVGLFAFVGLLYAGRWMMAVSSLVAAVILGLLANIVTAIFQGSNAGSFTLG